MAQGRHWIYPARGWGAGRRAQGMLAGGAEKAEGWCKETRLKRTLVLSWEEKSLVFS